MKNPFIYGKPVSGSGFINRQVEINQLASALVSGQNVILIAPRRYGKTSVIHAVLEKLSSQNHQCFYVDLYKVTSLAAFNDLYVKEVLSKVKTPIQTFFQWLQKALPALSVKLTYTTPETPAFDLDLNPERLKKGHDLNDILDAINKYMQATKKRAVIAFDEFQEILNMQDGSYLEKVMRSAFQWHKHVSYVFLGSQTHMMNLLFRNKSRPFYHFGKYQLLDIIEPKEWVPHLQRTLRKNGVPVFKNHVEELLEISGGHPHYTQMLAGDLWNLFHGSKSLSLDSLSQVLDLAMAREQHAFHEIWDSLNSRHRIILQKLAEVGPAEPFAGDFVKKCGVKGASSLQRPLKTLLHAGHITKTKNLYTVADPFFRLWLLPKQTTANR